MQVYKKDKVGKPNLLVDKTGLTSRFYIDPEQRKNGYSATVDLGNNNINGSYYSFLSGYGHTATVDGLYNAILSGEGHILKGSYSAMIAGFQNVLNKKANSSVVMGAYNSCDNPYTLVNGYQCISKISDPNNNGGNMLMGFRNKITGFGSNLFGANNQVTGGFCTVIGQSAKVVSNVPNDVNQANDLRFVVGNGEVVANTFINVSRSNAFEIFQSGVITAPSLTNEKIEAASEFVLTTKSYLKENYIKKPTAVYADNASAIAGGMGVNDTYRTADGFIKIVY